MACKSPRLNSCVNATRVVVLCLIIVLPSCTILRPVDFVATGPQFDILRFYAGHTRSTGLLQTSGGAALKRVATETWGHLEGGELHMTQDVTFDEGQPERRTWRIRQLDAHHFEARSEHVIGVAKGSSWGNALRLDYVLALNDSNPLTHLRMTHWMMLQPDRRTMLNVVTVRKFGAVVGRITEVFRHESDALTTPPTL